MSFKGFTIANLAGPERHYTVARIAALGGNVLVSVFYYETGNPQMRVAYLDNLELSPGGRVILPASFRRHKKIMAVKDGKFRLLNRCGERNTWEKKPS